MASLQVARRIGIGVAARGWSQVTAMTLALLAARVLGKADFGIYAIASVFVILLQGMMYGGIYDYIIKSRSEVLEPNTCFWMNLGFSVAGAGIIALLAPVMGFLTHAPLVTSLMLALAPSALLASLSTWQEALLLRAGRLTIYYTLGMAMETLACAAGVAALLGGFGVWAFVVYRYVQLALAGGSYFVVMRRLPRFQWEPQVARTVFAFASNIYVSRIVGTVSGYSADLLIGLLVSPASAGAYRLGSRVVLGVSEVAYQPVGTIAWVHFARAGRDADELRREWLALATALSLTVWPALAGLALLSRSVVLLVVGPGWDEAIPVIAVLAVGRALSLFDMFVDPILAMQDRTGMILRLRTAAALGSVLALSVLARHGAVGAAAAQGLVSLVLAVVAIEITRKATHLRPGGMLRALAPGGAATCAALAGAVAVRTVPGLSTPSVLHLAMVAACGVAAWAIVLGVVFRRMILPAGLATR